MRVYLSGTLTGRSKKAAVTERKKATKLLQQKGFEVFDPVSLEHSQKPHQTKFPKNHSVQDMVKFVTKEKQEIQKCDAMLVLTGDKPSDGTWLEMGFALYVCSLPVVLVAPLRHKDKLVSWANVESTYCASSIIDAVDKLVQVCQHLQS